MEPAPIPLRDLRRPDLPAVPGAYVIRDETDRVIYVGESLNLKRRIFDQHLSKSSARSAFRQSLGEYLGLVGRRHRGGYPPEVETKITAFLRERGFVRLFPVATKEAALHKQTELIRELSPVLNVDGRGLSHIDEAGRARMVDVGAKDDTARVAVARGRIVMQPETLRLLGAGQIAKGNVLTTAQVAGIMAAKRTHELIPMCHPLLLTDIAVELEPDADNNAVEITATVQTTGKTGVEMEALTAVSVAGLTVYDMCKAVDRGMRLDAVRLVSKSGGAGGDWSAE